MASMERGDGGALPELKEEFSPLESRLVGQTKLEPGVQRFQRDSCLIGQA